MSNKKPRGGRRRARSVSGDGTGKCRHDLYRAAWHQIEKAERAGFYLESITLLESLLADRLESRLSYLHGGDPGFRTLGDLMKLLGRLEKEESFRALYPRIETWAGLRNRALHELPKIEQGERTTWKAKTQVLVGIVKEGRELLLGFDKLDQEERRKGKQTATWPNAFGVPRIRRA